MATRQRFLDLAHSLPTGAPDYLLEQALEEWNPELVDGARAKMLSQLRLLTSRRVRSQWRTIWREAEADPRPRFALKFIALAVRVKNGEKL